MKCPKCGSELHVGARFCSKCGAEYIEEPAEVNAEEPAEEAIEEVTEETTEETQTVPGHEIGEEFELGVYNGTKLIWRILKIQNGMALVICKDSICIKTYHSSQADVTWNDCALRAWLNKEFFEGSISPVEKNKVLPCNVINSNNPYSKTPGGVTTTDKVFLLSIAEAEYLFESDRDRSNGKYWWLRSPGAYQNYAACVSKHGHIESKGYYVYGNTLCEDITVRPAMWMQLT